MARMTAMLAFLAIVIVQLLFLFRCSSPPTTPNPPPATTTIPPEPPPIPPDPIPPPAPAVNECEVVGLNQSGIRWHVEDTTLVLFVPMNDGGYVNVWTPEVNHTLLKRCDVNTECRVKLPGHGSHTIRLAAEIKTDRVYQCDRIRFDVEAKPPIPPPTTTIPSCEYESKCEVSVMVKKKHWGFAKYTACDYTGSVNFEALKNGGVKKSKTKAVDVGCDCVSGTLQLDLFKADNFRARCMP